MKRALLIGGLAVFAGGVLVLAWFASADPMEVASWLSGQPAVKPPPPCFRSTWVARGSAGQDVVLIGLNVEKASCDEVHPILCWSRPDLQVKNADARPDVAFKEAWIGGTVYLSPPFAGRALLVSSADSECQRHLSAVAATGGASRTGFAAHGSIPQGTVFWIRDE